MLDEDSGGGFGETVRGIVRAICLLALVGAGVVAVLWWSGSTVRFAAQRAVSDGKPTWSVQGHVVDDRTRAPIPWARVEDDPSGTPPFFGADADVSGQFQLATLPEQHSVRVRAHGYGTAVLSVGPAWWSWRPTGSETVTIALRRE